MVQHKRAFYCIVHELDRAKKSSVRLRFHLCGFKNTGKERVEKARQLAQIVFVLFYCILFIYFQRVVRSGCAHFCPKMCFSALAWVFLEKSCTSLWLLFWTADMSNSRDRCFHSILPRVGWSGDVFASRLWRATPSAPSWLNAACFFATFALLGIFFHPHPTPFSCFLS